MTSCTHDATDTFVVVVVVVVVAVVFTIENVPVSARCIHTFTYSCGSNWRGRPPLSQVNYPQRVYHTHYKKSDDVLTSNTKKSFLTLRSLSKRSPTSAPDFVLPSLSICRNSGRYDHTPSCPPPPPGTGWNGAHTPETAGRFRRQRQGMEGGGGYRVLGGRYSRSVVY